MNTGWELGRRNLAGEKDLVDTGGGGPGGVMARVGTDRGGEVRWESAGGKTPGGGGA